MELWEEMQTDVSTLRALELWRINKPGPRGPSIDCVGPAGLLKSCFDHRAQLFADRAVEGVD